MGQSTSSEGWPATVCSPIIKQSRISHLATFGGSYRIEEDIVKARGCSICTPLEGAVPPLQPLPTPEAQEHQEHQKEEGPSNGSWHKHWCSCST